MSHMLKKCKFDYDHLQNRLDAAGFNQEDIVKIRRLVFLAHDSVYDDKQEVPT